MNKKNRPNRRKFSIRTRILVIMLSLIAVIFLVVLAVFNILVREYIISSVNEQLRGVVRSGDESWRPGEQLPAGGQVGRAETMIVTEKYELVFPEPAPVFLHQYADTIALAAQLKREAINLQSREIMRLNAAGREYYLVSVELPFYIFGSGSFYLIYYIDMTAISSLAGRINTVLLVVMGVAAILAALIAGFLSGVIARPVREITSFATRIGRGDFSRNRHDYRDLELAELAESMNKAAAQLDAYDREQKTFFQNVSHELRTPLQAIRSSAEGIEHGILEPKQSSRVIISETDRLSEMVEDLLYLSRIDSISKQLQPVEYDLRELLSNSAERQRNLAAERGLRFVFDFDEEPVMLPCDEKSICRAFSNLIANAIRYAASRITLTCRRAGGRIIIAVVDDGPGIAAEDLPHIFDRFYKGKGGKHGIGLSIVKAVIEQHQGSITVRSSPGETTFTITFTS